MAQTYNHSLFEKKWQDEWDKFNIYRTTEDSSFPDNKRYYILDMFPYPSGSGLHVGHPEGYTASDILARFKRMNGFNVLHPMGWDAFGLPAENYAMKTGIHPSICTADNIKNFKRQIKSIGFSYDWEREIDTTDPQYFKWTQWIFIKLFNAGLAYESTFPINWCPSCKTGLANEEVVDGKCERCSSPVGKKNLRQWMLKITAYAEQLLNDLDSLDWPEPIKLMQRNWIGKSTGAEVIFNIDQHKENVTVFTTRPDTLFGATYMVLAPEHQLLSKIVTKEMKHDVDTYIKTAVNKSDTERAFLNKEKTGVFTGAYAINPVNGAKVPIWVADYVLITYGTGAIMAVPAHDERDYEFATQFNIPIIQVVENPDKSAPEQKLFTGDGIAINSGKYNGLKTIEFKESIIKDLEDKNQGKATVNYKLRDWVFSRQRYWGEPIPIVHCDKCGVVAVNEADLPLLLPKVEKFEPSGTGESPLVNILEWVNTTCPKCGGSGKRETNTMPQWAGSSWYYLRYIDPKNNDCLADTEKLKYWLPVDSYIGGAEHAVLHLLYSRFWHKFLYDQGVVPSSEPYAKLTNQGLIMGEDGQKMSKSLGNVINPDDVINEYGADVMRLYEMFMGPLEMSKPWSTKSISGSRRFLEKVWRLLEKPIGVNIKMSSELTKAMHKAIKKVTEDLEDYKFNTAISALMIYLNELASSEEIHKQAFENLLILLAPFAPHITEECWSLLGNEFSIHKQPWPSYKEKYLVESTMTYVFMVNGKVRGKKDLSADIRKDELLSIAKEVLGKHLLNQQILKEIIVPQKLVNFVVK
ncbi:MAG: leucine--tRNA ligase [Candidatus Margulisbacteria bacterium GWF2_35_9]|nr:MAG: leucine--tRNA ligase [Candidatus Margulisbacteria bacterium GWF2_35_9]